MTTQSEVPQTAYALPAGADLSAKQYRGCYIDTSGNIQVIDSGTRRFDGILQNLPKSTEMARLQDTGAYLKVQAGGTVTVGGLASFDATGRAVISVTSGDLRFGVILDAGAVGDVIRIKPQRGLPNVP